MMHDVWFLKHDYTICLRFPCHEIFVIHQPVRWFCHWQEKIGQRCLQCLRQGGHVRWNYGCTRQTYVLWDQGSPRCVLIRVCRRTRRWCNTTAVSSRPQKMQELRGNNGRRRLQPRAVCTAKTGVYFCQFSMSRSSNFLQKIHHRITKRCPPTPKRYKTMHFVFVLFLLDTKSEIKI